MDDSPKLKYLSRHVVPKVYSMWYELGVELLDDEDIPLLDNIEASNPKSCETCCIEMFKLWYNKKPESSWIQLLDALKYIHQSKLAKQLFGCLQHTGE